MSDKKTILGGTPVVEFEDAVEFLQTRAPLPCPACGHGEWSVSAALKTTTDSGDRLALGIVGVNIHTGVTRTQGVPLVLASCKKCAFIRMHGLTEISQWLEAGKPAFANDE